MVRAIAVSGKLLDDGVDPGDEAIMAKWDAWAFTYEHCAFVVAGATMVVITIVISACTLRNQRRFFHSIPNGYGRVRR